MPSDASEKRRAASAGPGRGGAATLETVLDQYLNELAEGGTPDQSAYLQAHPELADALRGVFKTLDFVETTSRSLGASQIEPGKTLGDYRIVREVGRGGMGVVYEAVQVSLGRRVALKILPSGAMLSHTALERFHREAATAGRLHHTNIVPVYAVGEAQGIHFYVMQFIDGQSLSQFLKRARDDGAKVGRDQAHRAARWARQAADALAYAHDHGIIHRDVKPSNLLIDADDNVWVTDFGLARADAHTTITLTGDVIGTARYMSPEQARGGPDRIDERTDVYSLGVTLYEMLALTPAFDGDSRDTVLNRILIEAPEALRRISPNVPKPLETVVAKCMEKEPDRRYARARDVAEDCRRFLEAEPIQARRPSPARKAWRWVRRRPAVTAMTLITFALAVVAFALVADIRRAAGARYLDEALDAILFEQDRGRASALLDAAARSGVNSADLHLRRALIPLFRHHPQGAFLHLTHALELDPQHRQSKLALALAYNASADFVRGREILQRIDPNQIHSALGWLLHGLALSKTQGSAAIESFDRAIRLKPDFTPAIDARASYRGVRLLAEGKRDELNRMIADVDALVVFRPNSARSYVARGYGRLLAAAYAATQADLAPLADGWLRNAQGDFDRAIALRREDDSLPFVRQGLCFRYAGDYRASADTFANAIAVDRTSSVRPNPYRIHERVTSLYALGEFKTALAEAAPACDASPNYCPLVLQRALLLAELGRLKEARAVCRDSIVRQWGDANGLFMSAVVLDLLGDRTAAEAALHDFEKREAAESSTGMQVAQPLPAQAIAFLTGGLDAESLMSTIADQPGRRCELAFLIAVRHLARGARTEGLSWLHKCIGSGVFIFSEYRLAQAFLARATADPNWPMWVARENQ